MQPNTQATPVLVAFDLVEQRSDQPTQAKEAIQLMIDAATGCANDAGTQQILTECERIYVPEGMWGYTDPARLIANAIGAHKAQTIFAKIGITQQTLMADACQAIQQGECEIAMVAAGEARYRELQARIQGVSIHETSQTSEPDRTMQPAAELWLEAETSAGLGMPVGYYAIMESAFRYAQGLDIESHRDQLAALYHRFSQVAADNPHAWKQEVVAAETIRNPGQKNKMLAFPYTKLHNTSWNVDQACAMVFMSTTKAQELGIDASQWVYPYVSAENNHMLAVAERQHLHRSIGAELAAQAALQAAGINADQLDYIDLYSCFPVAVEIYAQALGLSPQQSYTYTGGMPFAGGPLNNYALQAACRLFELLRENPGKTGLTSSVSGLITKQAFGIWGTQAPEQPFRNIDVTDQVTEQDIPLSVISDCHAQAVIKGYTIIFQGDVAQRAIAICELNNQQRTVAYSEDSELLQLMMEKEFCETAVQITGRLFSLSS